MRCFLLTVSQGCVLDRYTNNFSLFSVLEEVTPTSYPARLDVNTVAFFLVDDRDRGTEHEVRLSVAHQGVESFNSEPLAFTPTGARHRVRMNGLVLPEPGQYEVRIDLRLKGTDSWSREPMSWPLTANTVMQ
ncbi:MAG: hypothetical protein ACI8TX_002342 [Hyphomicrobiaceae bacterium]|jgi:hypothetical protein